MRDDMPQPHNSRQNEIDAYIRYKRNLRIAWWAGRITLVMVISAALIGLYLLIYEGNLCYV